MPHRIVITAGEPAGIGPELMFHLAEFKTDDQLVVIADKHMLKERFAQCFKNAAPVKILDYDPNSREPADPGALYVIHQPLAKPAVPGKLDPANAPCVLNSLDRAHDGLMSGEFSALVTGPVSKAVIDASGVPFTGHTEYLQHKCGVKRVVMLLGCSRMKVALATTHLPLKDVSAAITPEVLTEVITILDHDLKHRFGLSKPKIYVAGLNPHAGEDGHLGREELDVIIPTLNELRAQGFNLAGPLPADTLFTPQYLKDAAAYLCMYHDQGLPVLKYAGFDEGYNTTLGLPYIRTSVDHGTALGIAGTGTADPRSLFAAVRLAENMAAALHGKV